MNEIMHTVTKPFSEMLRFVQFHVTSISMQNFCLWNIILDLEMFARKRKK